MKDVAIVEILILIALCTGVPQRCGLGPHEVPVRNLYLQSLLVSQGDQTNLIDDFLLAA